MSKWTFRLIGLGVVVALSAVLFKTWFLPKQIPTALQKEISIHVNKKPISPAVEKTPSPPPAEQSQGQQKTALKDDAGDKPPSPPITLISYDDATIEKTTATEPTRQAERPAPPPPQPKVIVEQAKPQPKPPAEEKQPTFEVVEKTPPPEPEPEPAPKVVIKKSVPRGGNWVQAGAFSSQENTRNFVAQLRRKSWPVATEDAVVNGKLVHRVLVGPLSPSDVEEYINILGKMGINARQVSR